MASGDVDDDGYLDLAVGSYTTNTGSEAGATYLIYGPVSGYIDLGFADITIEGAAADEHAGAGVALGDIYGDGASELLLGSSHDSRGAYHCGAAYLFLTPSAGSFTTADADAWLLSDGEIATMGTSVAMGDLNADDAADLVLGGPADTLGAWGGGIWVEYAAD